jgi:two-component system sensor histidine kinase HydH
METAQEKEDVFRLPRWLLLLLVLGVMGLAFLMAQRDFGRESQYLEELYVQKGEVLIRSLTTAMRLGWTQGLSRENLAAFNDHLESAEVLYLAVTDVQGRVVSSSVDPEDMSPGAFKSPDSPPSFQKPPFEPHRRVSTQPNKKKIFWIYRPLWFTFQSPQPQARRERFTKDRRSGPTAGAPAWPAGPGEIAVQALTEDFNPLAPEFQAHSPTDGELPLTPTFQSQSSSESETLLAPDFPLTAPDEALSPLPTIPGQLPALAPGLAPLAPETVAPGQTLAPEASQPPKVPAEGFIPLLPEGQAAAPAEGLAAQAPKSPTEGLVPLTSESQAAAPAEGLAAQAQESPAPAGETAGEAEATGLEPEPEDSTASQQSDDAPRKKRWWHLEEEVAPPLERPPWPEVLGDWSKGLYCWVGFDMTPFEAAARTARQNSIIFIGLLGAAGLGGLLALFWAHNYRLSRRLYQDTNALASEIVARLPVGLILNDPLGLVTLVNQAALELTGLKQEEMMGQDLAHLTNGAFPADDDLTGLEMDLRFKDGPVQRLSLTCGLVVGPNGDRLGRVILLMDVGELDRLKEELERKRRLASLGGMAAGLAHEIRNPLGAIKGLTQHLLAKSEAGSQEALEVMLISVDRLERTITDFLDYAKPTELKTTELALGPFLRRIHELVGHDAQSQNVRMRIDLPEREALVLADDGRLAQAFLNLYLNAIQAVGPKGDGFLEVKLEVARQKAMVTLGDNGPGFGAEQLAQPFLPYFTSKSKGSGLGLALVKKIIEAHQGDVTLANRAGGGALVTVILPLLGQTSKYPAPPPKALPSQARGQAESGLRRISVD